MTYYAVIDTNVLVSAMLKWDSVPGNVMEVKPRQMLDIILADVEG